MRFTVTLTESGGGLGGSEIVRTADLASLAEVRGVANQLTVKHNFFDEHSELELNIFDDVGNIYDNDWVADGVIGQIWITQTLDPKTGRYELVERNERL